MIKYILGITLAMMLVGCTEKSDDASISTSWLDSSNFYCDKETGVEYLFIKNGYGGGLTPRYKLDGTIKSCGSK